MKTDPTFWLLARAAGITAYVLLTGVVLSGLVLKARMAPSRLRPALVVDVHRTLSTLALGAVALHAASLTLDQVAPISPGALLIPGLASYRPLWTSLGVLSADMMLLLAVSFPLRRFIGFRAWRRLHWLSYATFAGATLHGVFAGSDSGRPAITWMYIGALGLVASAVAVRALNKRRQPVKPVTRRPAAPAAQSAPATASPIPVLYR